MVEQQLQWSMNLVGNPVRSPKLVYRIALREQCAGSESVFCATALSRAQRETLEVVWTEDDATLSDRGFAGVLWTTAYAALGLDDRPGWEGHPVDAAWWTRLAAAGVRVPGAAPLEAAVARRGR